MIVVDAEMTGLDPKRCSIVSIGAVYFENPSDVFYGECRIFEGSEILDEALEINGFSLEEITNPDKDSLDLLLNKFIEWSKNKRDITLGGENPYFDRDFLKESFMRYGINWPFGYRLVDLHSVSYYHHLKKGIKPPTKDGVCALSLDKTLEYVGLVARKGTHNALEDAKLEAEAFSRLIYAKSIFEEYKSYFIPHV